MDRVEAGGDRADHQVGVAARADQRVGAQVVVAAEVLERGGELALVLRALVGAPAPPLGPDLEERELDEVALCHRP